MPTEINHNHRPTSPIVLDDKSGRKDKTFRRYASAVERALSLFDSALQEWADYISFLGRLLKAFQTRPPGIDEVPNSGLVAKRLSQCLSPMLPSGVHQKALEVYGVVFAILGKDGLTKELPLYLPGLSPLLSFASLSVKPALLSLFERFVIILDPPTLQPALKAIVLALLPGLEEEASEEFERTHALLNKFRGAVGKRDLASGTYVDVASDRYFWQSLFLATITSASRRQGALAYLERNLPLLGAPFTTVINTATSNGSGIDSQKQLLPPEIEAVVSPEPGLLIRCFAAGLQDEQLLTQRGFLDLLVTHLPLHSVVVQRRVIPEDLEILVAAAASVVARREMSLNRRLWVWFLGQAAATDADGSEPNSPESSGFRIMAEAKRDSPTQYFEQHGLTPLTNSLHKMFSNPINTPAVKARPFRICLSLMDRWEIGGLVIPRIFRSAMESIYHFEKAAASQDSFSEVLRSANVFFDGIQSRLIWKELIAMLHEAFDLQRFEETRRSLEQAQIQIQLVWFIISKFNIREEEMLSLHLPNALILLLTSVRNISGGETRSLETTMSDLIRPAYRMATYMLDTLPKRAFITATAQQGLSAASSVSQCGAGAETEMLKDIRKFYEESVQQDSSGGYRPFYIDLGATILPILIDLVQHSLETSERSICLEAELSLVNKVIKKAQTSQGLNATALLSSLRQAVRNITELRGKGSSFKQILGVSATLELLYEVMPAQKWHADHSIREIVTQMIVCLWAYMSPATPKHSVEAVRCLWRMQHISPDNQLVESTITGLLFQNGDREGFQYVAMDGARRFTTLWTHSTSASSGPSDLHPSPVRTDSQTDRRPDKPRYSPDILARPLLLLLDSLESPRTELFLFVSGWLQSLSNVLTILELLIRLLNSTPYLVRLRSKEFGSNLVFQPEIEKGVSEADESVYYIEIIRNIITLRSINVLSSLKVPVAIRHLKNDSIDSEKTNGRSLESSDDHHQSLTIQSYLVEVCMMVFRQCLSDNSNSTRGNLLLPLISVTLLRNLLSDFDSSSPTIAELEPILIKTLSWTVECSETRLQSPLIDCLKIVIKKRLQAAEVVIAVEGRPASKESRRNASQISLSAEKNEKEQTALSPPSPDPSVLDCLMFGLSSPNSRPMLEQWIRFLDDCLPLYASTIFRVLLPLVTCISKSIEAIFQSVQSVFERPSMEALSGSEPIHSLTVLFNALEQVLARGHDQMIQDEAKSSSVKSPEQVQGFFGSMVSALGTEAQAARSATANNRLTVLLCFKDAVKVSLKLWSWGNDRRDTSSRDATTFASFSYTCVRLRNRSRRGLENLFSAEPLECLETLIDVWQGKDVAAMTIMGLLHTLEASRPKNTMPAIFNAIYSRTNPNVLDPARKSTLTSELSDVQLAAFLVSYTNSMDDDALDEVWNDCMTFSRDVLGNPLPHRQTLPLLLEFIAVLGEKIDNTNFGEQRRMRREIGDLFVRLLAAMFTIKPLVFSQAFAPAEEDSRPLDELRSDSPYDGKDTGDIVAKMASILPKISKILVETDRIAPATATISAQILLPTFHWKTFPHNVTIHTLEILKVMSRIAEASRIWRKDVGEAFNDSKFFATRSMVLIEEGWMPILHQWTLIDRERMLEILLRLSAPTSAGIMFGVGASSARLEADRKAQLNLRRIALLVLSADDDAFLVNLNGIQEKLAELMNATAASSPSSVTRAEVYMVIRALILKNAPVHLASLWPIINLELYQALSSIGHIASRETYNITCILQAAKLLDTLLIIAPDDFQSREWLYITDTIDAVYRPSDWKPVALVDVLAETLDNKASIVHGPTAQVSDSQKGVRKPLLRWSATKRVPRENMMDQVLRPFLRQLSINAFESTYQMESADRKTCCEELLRDLFDDSTLV